MVIRVELKAKFDLLSTYPIEQQLLRSRSLFYIHGEKTSKLLAGQLKGISAKKQINKIRMKDGKMTTDYLKINETFKEFYSNLYKSEFGNNHDLMSEFLDRLNLPVLPQDERASLEKPISKEDIALAISSLQSGKSPGPDGFPVEFYKSFSKQLVPHLSVVLGDSFNERKLPASFNEASISLILKKGKESTECTSYRPISLLNVDMKILSKVLAHRLENILPLIINSDQTGFIKNRYSYYNINRLLNILYLPSTPVTECVLSLDAEKAFDRVEWEYLFAILDKFNFGSDFIKWIKLLYSCPMASVRSNLQQSDMFRLNRGTRQGCPLSPLLFDIVLEPLAVALRHCREFKGITRNGIEHKVSLYADDLLLFISNPEVSIPNILTLFTQFSQFSGYKLNLQKSELLPLKGPLIGYSNFPFKIVNDQFQYLGITITKNHKNLLKENFWVLVNKVKLQLAGWSPLSITMMGRINSIKMNILPKFLYLFQSLPIFIPKTFFTSLDSILSSYIWQGKHPRINKSHLQKIKRNGGLSLPDFRFYYWAINIRNLLLLLHFDKLENRPSWVEMELKFSKKTSMLAILGSFLPFSFVKITHNPVLRYRLRIWAQFRNFFGFNSFSLASPIIDNHLFQPSVMDVGFREWYRLGIHSFNDLFIRDSFATFEQLVNKFNLTNRHFFRYLQIRHFVQSKISDFPRILSSNFLDLLFNIRFFFQRGLTSCIYNNLLEIRVASMTGIKNEWERDLNVTFSDQDWYNALDLINASSFCARHCLLQFKVVHRIHMSKLKLSRFYSDIDPLCERCKIFEASLIHMFWECPNLERFWKDIFKSLSLIFKINIEPCPIIALFGFSRELNIPLSASQEKVLAFSTLIARRAILLKWKDELSPTHRQWLLDVMSFLSLEKIRYNIKDRKFQFLKIWGPFIEYYHDWKN